MLNLSQHFCAVNIVKSILRLKTSPQAIGRIPPVFFDRAERKAPEMKGWTEPGMLPFTRRLQNRAMDWWRSRWGAALAASLRWSGEILDKPAAEPLEKELKA